MPAYTFRSVGVSDTGTGTLTPGAPSGKATGDLLLLATGARAATETLSTPSGWTLLLDTTSTANDSCALFARIADGSGSDTPTFDWSGTSDGFAQIAAYYGDVFTDLANIIAHSAVAGTTSNTTNIPIPALTVTTDNCLLLAVGKKQKTATSDGGSATPPTGINSELADSWPTGATRLAFVWGYTQQTTATNFTAGVWDQSLDENLPYASLIVALKTSTTAVTRVATDAVPMMSDNSTIGISSGVPTWAQVPYISSESDTTYTVAAVRAGNASVLYAVAVNRGDTAPSIAQIKAGQNASGGTAKASASSSSGTGSVSVDLTPSDSPKFPIYDIYCVLNNALGDSTRQSVLGPLLDAPTGYLRVTLTSVSETGPLYGSIAAPGDVWQTDNDTTEDAYAITLIAQGDFQIAASGDTTRISFTQKLYDVSAAAWEGPGTVYVNNDAPVPAGAALAFPVGLTLEKDNTITPINLAAECTDTEGDTISVTVVSGTWPTGLAMGGAPNYTLSGTPTQYQRNVVTLRWADSIGDYYDEAVTVAIGVVLPDVVDDTVAAAQAQLAMASLTLTYQYAYHGTIVAGNVSAMSPAAATVVPYDQLVTLTVSLGPEP